MKGWMLQAYVVFGGLVATSLAAPVDSGSAVQGTSLDPRRLLRIAYGTEDRPISQPQSSNFTLSRVNESSDRAASQLQLRKRTLEYGWVDRSRPLAHLGPAPLFEAGPLHDDGYSTTMLFNHFLRGASEVLFYKPKVLRTSSYYHSDWRIRMGWANPDRQPFQRLGSARHMLVDQRQSQQIWTSGEPLNLVQWIRERASRLSTNSLGGTVRSVEGNFAFAYRIYHALEGAPANPERPDPFGPGEEWLQKLEDEVYKEIPGENARARIRPNTRYWHRQDSTLRSEEDLDYDDYMSEP
ncbi:MAG: hypothetical protein M1831_002991 [Alyxoria varia]|nr:MAG: hypothetical protein M1831_002991 [Alyxoria varia]